MECFADTTISAIIAGIGGDDSIRILPYIDMDVIRNNPKIFVLSREGSRLIESAKDVMARYQWRLPMLRQRRVRYGMCPLTRSKAIVVRGTLRRP